MDRNTFLELPTEEVATLVRKRGPRVVAFPTNGTRRWFLLECPPSPEEDFATAYVDATQKQHIEVYSLFFEHGVETLLSPIFGPDLFLRGREYMRAAADGLERLVREPAFLAFYERHQVRVRFYGEHRVYFSGTRYAYLSDLFDEITEKTMKHSRHRLYFGAFAQDAIDAAIMFTARYHEKHQRAPTRDEIVEMYYGERLPSLDVYIGFDKLAVFDTPLLATGSEDLYFMVNPSLYLTAPLLRRILYDHLFARRDTEPDYATLTAEEWDTLREFYRVNRLHTLGLGARHPQLGMWFPEPQVKRSSENLEGSDDVNEHEHPTADHK